MDTYGNLAIPFYIGGSTVAFSSAMTMLTHHLAMKKRKKEAAVLNEVSAAEEA